MRLILCDMDDPSRTIAATHNVLTTEIATGKTQSNDLCQVHADEVRDFMQSRTVARLAQSAPPSLNESC